MPAQRHHGTALIAALVVLGTLGIIGACAKTMIELGPLAHGILWFSAAFVAAHLAKRMLLEIDTGTLCTAAVVVIMLAIGIDKRFDGEPIDPAILVQLGLTLAGSLAGAVTARRATRVRPVFAVLGAGAAGFGASVLGLGLSLLIARDDVVYGLLIALPLGGLVTTLWSEVEALHTALGQALYFALLLFSAGANWGRHPDVTVGVMLGVVGAIAGFLLGAVGGAIGVKLRPAAKAEIPEARQVE